MVVKLSSLTSMPLASAVYMPRQIQIGF